MSKSNIMATQLRINRELWKQVDFYASQDKRSKNNFVNLAIEYYIEKIKNDELNKDEDLLF